MSRGDFRVRGIVSREKFPRGLFLHVHVQYVLMNFGIFLARARAWIVSFFIKATDKDKKKERERERERTG